MAIPKEVKKYKTSKLIKLLSAKGFEQFLIKNMKVKFYNIKHHNNNSLYY